MFGSNVNNGILKETPWNNGQNYWLAFKSNSNNNYSCPAIISDGAYIYQMASGNENGYRPIICLKSDVILKENYEENGDISYTLE